FLFLPQRSSAHVPTFSARHPMIPRLYVMPWRQDMKNQRLLLKVALAQIPVLPHEESLCLCGRERLCHIQDQKQSLTDICVHLTEHQTSVSVQN
uniref:Uncharacterized protein n=1 Tax=Sphaeramia orbicularis TaxID=375764 RepID=A0A672ZPW2_9TELE